MMIENLNVINKHEPFNKTTFASFLIDINVIDKKKDN